MFAPFPHHVSARGAFALKIFGDDAVIADQRKGLQNDLSRVAGVGQGFHVSAHAGGEHQLSHCGVRGAECLPLDHLAVGKDQVPFHTSPAPPIMAASTALMVCIRFSASSNTTDCGLSNTPLLTSMASLLNFSHFSLPIAVFLS